MPFEADSRVSGKLWIQYRLKKNERAMKHTQLKRSNALHFVEKAQVAKLVPQSSAAA
jgi:hypothetical protein